MTTERALVAAPAAVLSSSQILAGLNTVRSVLAPDLTPEELRLFSMVAARSGLDPFAKQIYAVKRKGRVTFQTGIDGYRSIAARTGLYDGQDEPDYGPACECGDNRPVGHPEFATVRVYRKGVGRAIAASAYWHEYVPSAGPSGEGDVMWRKMPRVMLAKVAEALALRKAFPYDPENRQGIGADVYTVDEMAQAERPAAPAAQPTARERIAQRAQTIAAEPSRQEVIDHMTNEQIGMVISGRGPEEPPPPLEEPEDRAPEVTDVPGLTLGAFREICRMGGKATRHIASALECVPADVGKRVEGMSDAERGALAEELGLDWRPK